jgi:hypothetical protein
MRRWVVGLNEMTVVSALDGPRGQQNVLDPFNGAVFCPLRMGVIGGR